jgi:hypothetical protein
LARVDLPGTNARFLPTFYGVVKRISGGVIGRFGLLQDHCVGFWNLFEGGSAKWQGMRVAGSRASSMTPTYRPQKVEGSLWALMDQNSLLEVRRTLYIQPTLCISECCKRYRGAGVQDGLRYHDSMISLSRSRERCSTIVSKESRHDV